MVGTAASRDALRSLAHPTPAFAGNFHVCAQLTPGDLVQFTDEVSMRPTRPDLITMTFAACLVMAASVCGAQAQTATDPQKQATEPSPQGQTGPLNTGAGGAPPSSPQGETPPDMQATSPGAADAPKGR
jgi:hypothetical protein